MEQIVPPKTLAIRNEKSHNISTLRNEIEDIDEIERLMKMFPAASKVSLPYTRNSTDDQPRKFGVKM